MRLRFDCAMRKEQVVWCKAQRLAPTAEHRVFWGDAKFSLVRKGSMPTACALIRRAI
jgi:hypothetical protein